MDDSALAVIRALYGELRLIRYSIVQHRESPAYRAQVLRIRQAVDARTKQRGQEWIVVSGICGHPTAA